MGPRNTPSRREAISIISSVRNSYSKSDDGKVCADRCYVSKKLAGKLLEDFGITFFAKPKRNMKNQLMRLTDKLMFRKRSIIETIIDQFKNISQIEHSRASQPHQFSGQCRLWVDC